MKRFLHNGFVILVILITALAACAPQASTQPATSQPQPITQTSAPPTLTPEPTGIAPEFGVELSEMKDLQVQFLHPWTGKMQDELIAMVDEFNQTNEWGIHVVMSAPGSAAMVSSKAWEGIANDQPANILAASTSFLLTVDEKTGLVVDLDDYVNSSTLGLSENEIADIVPMYWNEDSAAGRRFGVPAQRSGLFLAYNRTWASELGFSTAPRNTDELRTQLCAANESFKENADPVDDGLGGWLINTEAATMLGWLHSFGVDPFDGEHFQFSGAAGESTFNYLLDLKLDSCAWMGKPGKDVEYFTNRQALAVTAWSQDLEALGSAFKRNNSTDEWTVIPFPGADRPTVLTSGVSYGILHNTPAEDLAAWLFIRWIVQPAQQARLLKANPTLPISRQTVTLMGTTARSPRWTAALELEEYYVSTPLTADWQVVGPVLEDAGWQLLRTDFTEAQIPDLMTELDTLAEEMAERHP